MHGLRMQYVQKAARRLKRQFFMLQGSRTVKLQDIIWDLEHLCFSRRRSAKYTTLYATAETVRVMRDVCRSVSCMAITALTVHVVQKMSNDQSGVLWYAVLILPIVATPIPLLQYVSFLFHCILYSIKTSEGFAKSRFELFINRCRARENHL